MPVNILWKTDTKDYLQKPIFLVVLQCEKEYSPIAQLAERIAVNDDVTGSSPVRGAIMT